MGAKKSRRSPGPRRDTQAYYSSIVQAVEQCMRHLATLLLALLAFVSSTTFCSPIAFIASGCTTMHQQFGTYRLPPISGQINLFCLQVNPWRIIPPSFLPSNNVCATCNFYYSFALFPISFSVLFGICVLNYIFDVATGQDPEMNNSAAVHLTTIFFVKDSQEKAMLQFAPVRSSHRDVFSTSTITGQDPEMNYSAKVHRTTIFFVKGQSGKSNASFCSGAFIALGCVQHIHKHLAISSVRIMPLTPCFLRCSSRAPLVEASPRLAHTFSTERRAFKREHSSVPYESYSALYM